MRIYIFGNGGKENLILPTSAGYGAIGLEEEIYDPIFDYYYYETTTAAGPIVSLGIDFRV